MGGGGEGMWVWPPPADILDQSVWVGPLKSLSPGASDAGGVRSTLSGALFIRTPSVRGQGRAGHRCWPARAQEAACWEGRAG